MTSLFGQLQSSLLTIGLILAAMAVVALIETVIPLQVRGRWNRTHLGPNLALTFITFATNLVFNAALVVLLSRLQSSGVGLLHRLALPPLATVAAVVLAFDFTSFVTHVAMHKIPSFWRHHSVHHSDLAVDVTTTIRQHPGESVIRYGFMATTALALGPGPGPFAVYRVWSALHGLLEHANVRVPLRLERLLSVVISTPNMHKIHHSRAREHTDRNFGNIFSLFDRMCFTFIPARYGTQIVYGIDGLDDPTTHTTAGLLALPFRRATASSRAEIPTLRAAGR